jgi:hypothetical protein
MYHPHAIASLIVQIASSGLYADSDELTMRSDNLIAEL